MSEAPGRPAKISLGEKLQQVAEGVLATPQAHFPWLSPGARDVMNDFVNPNNPLTATGSKLLARQLQLATQKGCKAEWERMVRTLSCINDTVGPRDHYSDCWHISWAQNDPRAARSKDLMELAVEVLRRGPNLLTEWPEPMVRVLRSIASTCTSGLQIFSMREVRRLLPQDDRAVMDAVKFTLTNIADGACRAPPGASPDSYWEPQWLHLPQGSEAAPELPPWKRQ